MLAQQAWDVGCAVRYLASREDVQADGIALYGRGSLGTTATLAGALFDSVAAIVAEESIGSFLDAIGDPLPQPLWIYAPNILKVADIPQLAALCPQDRLLWINPIGPGKTRLSEATAEELRQRVGSDAKVKLSLEGSPIETIADFLADQRATPGINSSRVE
jgi:hypothetical protein